MKNQLVVVLILCSLGGFGQSSNRVDSLKQLVGTSDNARVYFELYKTFVNINADSAFRYLEKSRLYLDDDREIAIQIRKNFGREFLRRGFYSMSQKESFEALKLAIEHQDSLQIGGIYNNLGLVASHTHLYEKAAEYYQRGLKYASEAALERTLKNNYGLTLYMGRNDEYKALGIYQELLRATKDSVQMCTYHNNIGTVFLQLKNYDSAYKHILATLAITTVRRDTARSIFNYALIGQYYFQTQNYTKAKSYLKLALSLDSRFGDNGLWATVEVPGIYRSLVDIYTLEGKPDSIHWIKDFYIGFLSDKLAAQRKNSAEFVFGNQESELERIEQKQRQSRKNLAEYYGIAVVILSSLVIYFIFSGKDRRRSYTPYFSVIILVLAFEFILVVLDPFISKFTNDEPLYAFICNAILAFMIVPIQIWGERILRKFAVDIRIRNVTERAGDGDTPG